MSRRLTNPIDNLIVVAVAVLPLSVIGVGIERVSRLLILDGHRLTLLYPILPDRRLQLKKQTSQC